jgi:hypothetical protein
MRTRLAFLLVSTFAAIGLVLACAGTPTTPSEPFKFALSPSTVAAGATSVGSITVRGGTHQLVRIDLTSSDAVASVPSSVLVAPGTTAEFKVATRLVAANTIARITATVGDVKQEIALQVVAPVARPATLDILKLEAASVRGGQDVQGTVGLTALAPASGLSVTIRSSNAAAVVPATVLIQSGELNAGFIVSTRPVALDTHLEITASYSDQARTVPLRVTP